MFSILLTVHAGEGGFFKVSASDEGVHAFLAPDGSRMFMSAVERVYRRYPEQRKSKTWISDALRDLDAVGFTALGAGPDRSLRMCRPYAYIAWIAESMTTSDDPDDYISATKYHAPCTGFPNVFSPKWPSRAREWAKRVCGPVKDNPFLIGWYLDNELKWWGAGPASGCNTGLYDAVAALPSEHSARRALESFVAGCGHTVSGATDSVRRDFVEKAARLFFKESCAAVREADPNHLILGVRFAGLDSAPDCAWRLCGEYCDVVSVNVYPWADLDSQALYTSSAEFGGRDLRTVMEMRHRQTGGRPMIVSEWGYSALDSKLACLKGAGQRFYTQRERAAAVELTLREFASLPFLVGCSWFRYMDMDPKMGDVEDCNYGLIARNGRMYGEVADSFRRVHRDIANLRSRSKFRSSMPVRRAATGLPADDAARLAPSSKKSGFALRTPIGSVATLAFEEKDCGTFGPMVSYLDAKGRERWQSGFTVLGAGVASDGSYMVTNRFSRGAIDIRIVMRLTFSDGGRMFAELRQIENAGSEEIVLRKFYFRNEPSFVRTAKAINERLNRRQLWNAVSAAAWISQDGFFIGALSSAPLARPFSYSVRNNGRSVHPDAAFACADSGDLRLASGSVWRTDGRVWAIFVAGRGGEPAWVSLRTGMLRGCLTL
jgi:agarase